jgi:hypothetical protein
MNPSEMGAVVIDPGAPMEHTREVPAAPVTQPTTPAANPDAETRIAALEKELRETRSTEQYWRGRAAQPAAPAAEEADEETEAPLVDIAEAPAEDAEAFLNDLNADGLNALKKRGVITGPQLATALQNLEQRLAGRYQADVEGRTFDNRLNTEFPDLVADSERVANGEAPKTELYRKTAVHFKALIKDSPGVKAGSVAGRGLMLAAARMAKQELSVDTAGRREEERRERISGQPGGGRRSGGPDTSGSHESELTETQRSVISALGRYGVDEGKFRQFQGGAPAERRNGRG